MLPAYYVWVESFRSGIYTCSIIIHTQMMPFRCMHATIKIQPSHKIPSYFAYSSCERVSDAAQRIAAHNAGAPQNK